MWIVCTYCVYTCGDSCSFEHARLHALPFVSVPTRLPFGLLTVDRRGGEGPRASWRSRGAQGGCIARTCVVPGVSTPMGWVWYSLGSMSQPHSRRVFWVGRQGGWST